MDRLSILVGRLIKSMAPTNIFFKVPQVGRFLHLVGDINRLLEPLLELVSKEYNEDISDWVYPHS